MTQLRIQDLNQAAPTLLIEDFAAICANASSVKAAFAFASRSGIATFFSDKTIKGALKAGANFDIIVGTSSITTRDGLKDLGRLARLNKNLVVRAFVSDVRGRIFHPKMLWAKHTGPSIDIVVGSGNLTSPGLTSHWEAWSLSKLTGSAIASLEKEWAAWTALNSQRLTAVDHPDAQKAAELNERNLNGMSIANKTALGLITKIPPSGITVDGVHIREVNGGGKSSRWQQVNFLKSTFLSYFGVHLGMHERFVFWNINFDGSVDDAEVRPPVPVISHNYRFEFSGHTGLPKKYPPDKNSRPIIVLARVGARMFRYMILIHNDPHYTDVRDLMLARSIQPAGRMRECLCTLNDLQSAAPGIPV